MSETAKLIIEDKTYELPVLTGSENEKAIDISKLRAMTGYVTLDKGFKNTGSTTSAITFLNGEKGILRYRGYPIEQLAEKAEFLEVAYLLIYGELPTSEEYSDFKNNITNHTLIHEDMRVFLEAYPIKAHPMGILSAAVCTLSTFYPESQKQNRSSEAIDLTIQRLLAKLPTLAAWAYKNSIGHPVNSYLKDLLLFCQDLNLVYQFY